MNRERKEKESERERKRVKERDRGRKEKDRGREGGRKGRRNLFINSITKKCMFVYITCVQRSCELM